MHVAFYRGTLTKYFSTRESLRQLLPWFLGAIVGLPVFADSPGPNSLAEAYEELLRLESLAGPSGQLDLYGLRTAPQNQTLSQYALECERATGIPVPAFNCDNGVSVPGQGDVPRGTLCDQPNVLNGVCDPGSKFQVLPGRTADAVAVAHCRRNGEPVNGPLFQDIAVIQYNKKNGAVCFYQALSKLPAMVPAPIDVGEGTWPGSATGAHWIDPVRTERIGCPGCHNNGGFVRSSYLAQLRTGPNALPNASTGFANDGTPLRFVGSAYADNLSWSVEVPELDANGQSCTVCHKLAVSNKKAFGFPNGSASNFSAIATAATQISKSPHSPSSPIWMRPGQIVYSAESENAAKRYQKCALDFFDSNFQVVGPGCKITPLGLPWQRTQEPRSNDIAAIVEYIMRD